MLTEKQTAILLDAINIASISWKSAFNKGDAAGCASHYEETAVMRVKPLGTFVGTVKIQEFWQNIINDGFSDVEYLEPKIVVVDEVSGILSAGWKMNKAKGIIHKELWILQEDGKAKLQEDNFEIIN